MLSSVSKHNMWSYYDWVYCCCLPSVNTICGRIMIGFSFCRPSVNTICGRIMIGLSLLLSVSKHNMWSYYDWLSLSSVSKHNMWSYYDWVYCCCRPSVNTICGRIMIGFIVFCRPSVNTICGRIMIGFIVFCRPSVNTICGRIMIGLSLLLSVSKHNIWSYYDRVVVVVVRQ